MSTYPTTPRAAFLQWCDTHAPVFVAQSTHIGLTDAQAAAFASQIAKANDAAQAQDDAKNAQKAATVTVDACVTALQTMAGDAVRSIRAFAELQADPTEIYTTAQIPPPATPTPVPPPAQPSDLTVTLDATTGSVTLRWKATNPTGGGGTAYIIKRKLPGQSEFSFVGVSGKKEFVDETLVAGPDWVQYTVQGQRSNVSGPVSPVFTVNFGNAPDGSPFATVSSGGGMNAGDAALVEAIVNSKANGNGMSIRKGVRG